MTRSSAGRALVLLGLVGLVSGATGMSACSVLLDWSDFTGGVPEGGIVEGGSDGPSVADGSDSAVGPDGPASDSNVIDVATDGPVVSCGDGGQCVPAMPAGWTGPVALYAGAAPAPSCPGGAAPAFTGNGGTLTASPATCSSCSCSTPTGVTCADPVMSFWIGPNCSMANGTSTVTSSCAPTPLETFAVTLAASQATGGMCTGTGGSPTIPPYSWANVAVACGLAAPSVGCPAGDVCALAPGAPFSTGSCVMQGGVATQCPAGYPAAPQVFYTGVSDSRGCTPCCGAPVGGQCSATVNTYMSACTGSPASTLVAPATCASLIGPEPVDLAAAPSLTSPGACAVGGAPTGSAMGDGATAVTFCCTQ